MTAWSNASRARQRTAQAGLHELNRANEAASSSAPVEQNPPGRATALLRQKYEARVRWASDDEKARPNSTQSSIER